MALHYRKWGILPIESLKMDGSKEPKCHVLPFEMLLCEDTPQDLFHRLYSHLHLVADSPCFTGR